MILTKLMIDDFGVFRGQHTVDLGPKPRRPIILFGGKNGAGKSTILEALRICLYGMGALGTAISKDDYLKFLDRRIHTNPNALIQPTFASISLEFQYSHADGLATYVVTRSWERRASNKISEFLTIERNGKTLTEVEAEHWQDFLRELIPPGVSQLFFFDGEKIQQLAEDTTDQQALADAVKSLLGVDIVERLQADLRLHRARLAKPNRGRAELSEVHQIERTIAGLHKKLAKVKQQRADLERKIQTTKENLQRAENTFAQQGGVLARNRELLVQQEASLKERTSQFEEAIRHSCAGLLPFALVPGLCRKLRERLLAEEASAQTQAGQSLLLAAKKELSDRLNPSVIFAGLSDISEKARDQIHTRINSALLDPLSVEQLKPTARVHQLSEATARLLVSWMQQATTDLPATLNSAAVELEKSHRELHKVAESLRKIPADDVLRPILDEIHSFNEKLAKSSGEAMHQDEVAKELELELSEAHRRHARFASKLTDAARDSGKLAVLPRVERALEEYRLKLIDKKVSELQKSVTECFNLLCRKKDALRTIKIQSRDFSISLCDRNGRPLPKAQLSAGEKQIYAISMLWALGRTSGRPLPIVIDTPLARLDSDHRRLLVENYFPHASHQVIVLSTDTEVDQAYFDLLKPSISRAHHLDYDQTESCTLVRQGYFWRDSNEAYKVAAK